MTSFKYLIFSHIDCVKQDPLHRIKELSYTLQNIFYPFRKLICYSISITDLSTNIFNSICLYL